METWGLVWGGVAAALALFGAGYGVRRRSLRLATRWRAGKAATWLRLHLLSGALFLLAIEIHIGFRLPEGWLTWALWLVSLATVAGGAVGLTLQRWIPRQLASGLSHEVHYERIPELVAALRERAEAIGEGGNEAIRRLWEDQVAGEMERPRRRPVFFLDITGGIRGRLEPFRHLARFLPEGDRERLDELEALYRAKLEIDAHLTLQGALRGWMMAHSPLAVLLVGLLALHVFSVLYY